MPKYPHPQLMQCLTYKRMESHRLFVFFFLNISVASRRFFPGLQVDSQQNAEKKGHESQALNEF